MRHPGRGVGRGQDPQHLSAVPVVGGDDAVRRDAIRVGSRSAESGTSGSTTDGRGSPHPVVGRLGAVGHDPGRTAGDAAVRDADPRGAVHCRNEIVEPTAVSCSCVPAGNGAGAVRASELGPRARSSACRCAAAGCRCSRSRSRGTCSGRRSASAPPARSTAHPTAGSRSTSICDDWSPAYVSPTRMSPAVALAPSTACEEIDRPPSPTAAQPAPNPPSARLKSSEPR